MILDNPFKIAATVVAGVAVVVVALNSYTIVDAGHRGVKKTLGKVEEVSLTEGIYFYNPIITTVIPMDTRVLKFTHETHTYTRDVQQSKITYTVNVNLRKEAAAAMFRDVGLDWQDILVPQVVEGTLKQVVGKWDAVDLVGNRDKATIEIEAAIKAALAKQNVDVSKFEITNIDYNDEFEKAVEAKVTAIQRASEAENKTKQISEEAKQKVITAKAEAEAMKIKGDALSSNPSLVQWEAAQKWDGVLPTMNLGGATPFINITAPTTAPKQ